ncbi:MAG: glycosyltransferase family 2 protein [Bacteroidetes bacterium]|nr:glycosyltransferase family 2 protein [Bacteroidota bacterium]
MVFQSVYIVILNYNGYEDTKNCIYSIQNCKYENFQIVIVDNASSDNSIELLQNNFSNHHIIKSEKNGGYSYGMNLGIRYALDQNAEFILILNNDTIVDTNCLDALVQCANSDKNIGVVSPKVGYIGQEDKLYCGGGDFSVLKGGGVALYQGKSFEKYATNNREINFAEGCCLLVSRKVFEKVGLLEEKFFMYFEDLEFAFRVNKLFKIVFCSNAIIYHRSGAGRRWIDYSALYYFYYTRNRFWVFSEHNIFIKIYILLFSTLNTIHKYLVLKIYSFNATQNKKYDLKKAIKSLKEGFFEGINLLFVK